MLGYVMDKEQWGRGIMSQAVALFCPLVFEGLDVLRLSARVMEENIPSCRVLEKNGFRREGVVKWEPGKREDPMTFGSMEN